MGTEGLRLGEQPWSVVGDWEVEREEQTRTCDKCLCKKPTGEVLYYATSTIISPDGSQSRRARIGQFSDQGRAVRFIRERKAASGE